MYLVLALVLSDRTDFPATGHKDCIRDDNGFIVSVPGK